MTRVKKITMGAIVASLVAAVASIDAFAFEDGAVATISQVWLTLNRWCFALTYALSFGMGVLLVHVSLPRDPGRIPDPPLLRHLPGWTLLFLAGIGFGFRYAYQRPNVD